MIEARIESLPQTPGTEGDRRPSGVPDEASTTPDVEVIAQTRRRRLTVGYKIRVIETVAELKSTGNGSIGSYLRKKGELTNRVKSCVRD